VGGGEDVGQEDGGDDQGQGGVAAPLRRQEGGGEGGPGHPGEDRRPPGQGQGLGWQGQGARKPGQKGPEKPPQDQGRGVGAPVGPHPMGQEEEEKLG
jgi:hypothetical protein